MAQTSTAKRLDETLVELEPKRPGFGGGEPPPVLPQTPIGNKVWLADLVFLRAEAIVFAGLMGGYIVFLAVQGYEWLRLIQFGLTVSSSVYGGLFYTLIGFHALHVFGALVWLTVVFALARRGHYSKDRYLGVQTCAMYWTFVVALWPALYGLVYLY